MFNALANSEVECGTFANFDKIILRVGLPNISNKLSLEILLYISGQRQIKVAIEEFGAKSGDNILIILGNSEETVRQALMECEKFILGAPSDDVMAISASSKLEAIREFFQIDNKELNAVGLKGPKDSQENVIVKLVLNRVALVTLEK